MSAQARSSFAAKNAPQSSPPLDPASALRDRFVNLAGQISPAFMAIERRADLDFRYAAELEKQNAHKAELGLPQDAASVRACYCTNVDLVENLFYRIARDARQLTSKLQNEFPLVAFSSNPDEGCENAIQALRKQPGAPPTPEAAAMLVHAAASKMTEILEAQQGTYTPHFDREGAYRQLEQMKKPVPLVQSLIMQVEQRLTVPNRDFGVHHGGVPSSLVLKAATRLLLDPPAVPLGKTG